MLLLQGVGYTHPNGNRLFSGIDFHLVKNKKLAIVGNNGTGKSTLLRMLAGLDNPSSGSVQVNGKVYYQPQVIGLQDPAMGGVTTIGMNNNTLTVAGVLGIGDKYHALKSILEGNATEDNLLLLDEDWTLEERCAEAFGHWNLGEIDLGSPISGFSGGERTRIRLAGIRIHQPDLVLLDEPSNHLDSQARELLYQYISGTRDSLVIVSHDRSLLALMENIAELSDRGLQLYGGNYSFYQEQKKLEVTALADQLQHQEKQLRQARQKARDTIERQQKLDARGKKKQEKSGLPTISMNTFRNNAEKSTARTKAVHENKTESIADGLRQLRESLPAESWMTIGFDHSGLHTGKTLVNLEEVGYTVNGRQLWATPASLEIRSGERIAITGSNGAGKSTLLRMIVGETEPTSGKLTRNDFSYLYIDQDYTLLDPAATVYTQAAGFNPGNLEEHQIRSRLNRFLFTQESWDKPVTGLSGGERLRLVLCSLSITQLAPDMLLLDEPSNNLDLPNLAILARAVNEYKGTLLLISHDAVFAGEVGINRQIHLESSRGN